MSKQIIAICLLVAMAVYSAFAQAVINGDFDGEWTDCIPWTSSGNNQPLGIQPAGWHVSNVIGINVGNSFTGSTITAHKVIDANGGKAVKLTNTPNTMMPSLIVPGFLTLGTPFATAQGSVDITNRDGGVFGGVPFDAKPDALAFDYQRQVADESGEPASVVAYLWRGCYTQSDVPGEISGSPAKTDITDRDRNILGMETATGGGVTDTDGELIAKINHQITTSTDDWSHAILPFDYVSDATPQMINVIFASNDYFGSPDHVVPDNSLTIDNVSLVYYSRIANVTYKGRTIPDFDSNVFDYTFPVQLPAGVDAEMIHMLDIELLGHTATIIDYGFGEEEWPYAYATVAGAGPDVDGETQHTYRFFFNPEAELPDDPDNTTNYLGTITIDTPDTNTIVTDGQSISIMATGVGLCRIGLYHFSLDGTTDLGNIVIDDVVEIDNGDTKLYFGAADNIQLTDNTLITSAECDGILYEDGTLSLNIDVVLNDALNVNVTFNGSKQSDGIDTVISDNGTGTTYYSINGRRLGSEPASGIYIVRQGNKTIKAIK